MAGSIFLSPDSENIINDKDKNLITEPTTQHGELIDERPKGTPLPEVPPIPPGTELINGRPAEKGDVLLG